MRYRMPLIAGMLLMVCATAYAGTGGGKNMAGCGLGELVFKDNQNTKGVQSTAATSNGLFYSQQFGITSGTSGCSNSNAWVLTDRGAFIAVNYRALSRELAVGQGEYASSLASLMGCGEKSVPAFLSFVKSRYERLFPTQKGGPELMLKTLDSEIAGDAALSKACVL